MSYLTVQFIQQQMFALQQGNKSEEEVVGAIEAEVWRKSRAEQAEHDAKVHHLQNRLAQTSDYDIDQTDTTEEY